MLIEHVGFLLLLKVPISVSQSQENGPCGPAQWITSLSLHVAKEERGATAGFLPTESHLVGHGLNESERSYSLLRTYYVHHTGHLLTLFVLQSSTLQEKCEKAISSLYWLKKSQRLRILECALAQILCHIIFSFPPSSISTLLFLPFKQKVCPMLLISR